MIEQSWPYLLAVSCLSALVFIVFKKRSGKQQLDPRLSQKERMFTSILEKAVGEGFRVVCKVPMDAVFDAETTLSERAQRKAVKPLLGLQFDYIVCAQSNDAIICAVELDDHIYHKARDKQQDLFIEELCYETGLPLLRVAPQNGYNLVEIIERFEHTISAFGLEKPNVEHTKFNLKVIEAYRPQHRFTDPLAKG
ncbi:MAG: hypothetical protein ACJAZ4_002279 [Neptuniibacter pectenicola]|uniref:DUF2726 domain-containing protein n=1 Tax=Neptuniibacter pectenicola TaxID=1806669 RepID=UPI00079A6498|nr:MAG: hypothetical protein AXW15_02485 [Neptuniibacter sp. Phe_28]